ncbi:lipopolysaccharide biosynthesis protein [Roseateles sp.]|uniref:lipopolysaccharide biosynthesis protein n=1 Tax=Roseateles sp. TaxID=1971397 RepID=UPI0039E9B755
MSLRNQALSGFRWTAGARLTSQLITWSITLIVIRILSPADYGLLAMATVFVSLLNMFSELGLGAAIVQKPELDDTLVRRVFAVVLSVHFLLAALLILAAPLIGRFYEDARVVPVVQALSLQFVLAAFAVVPNSLLQRQMEFKFRSLLDLGAAVFTGVVTLFLAFRGLGVWALVVGSLLGQLCRTVGLNLVSPYFKRPNFALDGMWPLLKFGGSLTLAQVLGMLFLQADILICAKIIGTEFLGFYTIAMHLASLPNQRISALVNQVAFPAFSSMQSDPGRVAENMLLGARILGFVTMPILWGLSGLSSEIISVILGEKWMPALLTLQVIALVMPLRMVANFIQVANQGIGRAEFILTNAIWAVVVGPILFFAGSWLWGGAGLSLSWLLVSPILFLQIAFRGGAGLPMERFAILRSMGHSLLPALGMLLAIHGARLLIGDALGALFRLPCLILLGAVVYILLSRLANHEGLKEVLGFLRGLRGSKA